MNCEAQARWEQKTKPKKQQRSEDNQDIAERVIQQAKTWASGLAQAVWEGLTIEEEQTQTQPEDCSEETEEDNIFSDQAQQVFKHGAVISKVMALIETGIEDMTGASNGIITWNWGNIQAMVKVDDLLVKLGQDPKQSES